MDKKKVVVIIGALVMALVTAMIARSMFAGAGAQQAAAAPVATGPKVLVARKPLPVGTIIDAESLVYQPWPKELIESAYYLESQGGGAKGLVGTVVRYAITAGQPVTRGSLVGPQDRGFLAAALGPGMRAVTVPVNASTGVAGFVFPGDRVDIVLTQEVVGGGDGAPLKVSETIVRNARVLATDQRFSEKDAEGKTEIKAATNVTLEVTPRIAEKVAVGQSVGTLSLVLRSIADNGSDFERAVAAGEVKLPKGMSPADERKMMASIANRPSDALGSYTTGGDVSRFQRKTVPGKEKSGGGMGDALKAMMGGGGGAGSGQNSIGVAGQGPTVKVARGNDVSMVAVGSK